MFLETRMESWYHASGLYDGGCRALRDEPEAGSVLSMTAEN